MAALVQHRLPKSKWFYGKVKIDGKYKPVPLDVEVKGTPPKHRGDAGDEAYKRSMWEAEQRLEPLLKELKGLSFPEATKAVKRFGELMKQSKKGDVKDGDSDYILAEKIGSEWSKLPRKSTKAKLGNSKNDGKTHGDQVVSKIEKFFTFCKKRNPKLKYAFEITKGDAVAYIQSEWDQGHTGSTCNNNLTNLRSVFGRLKTKIGYTHNPFDEVEKFPDDTINRRPFTDDQIVSLYEEALKDLRSVGGIIITGIFTGMREGDCCLLRWEEVNLDKGAIEATPEPAPAKKQNMKTGEKIWIPMFPQFKKALMKLGPKKSGYIFPKVAKLYKGKPDELSKQVVAFIERTFAEDENFVRTVKREHGLRKASVYDFPALRTTWITLAVRSGISTVLICLVTGHTDEKMIIKHYAKPDAKSLQASFESKMVALSTLGMTTKELDGDLGHQLLKLKDLLSDGTILDIERKRKWAIGVLNEAIRAMPDS